MQVRCEQCGGPNGSLVVAGPGSSTVVRGRCPRCRGVQLDPMASELADDRRLLAEVQRALAQAIPVDPKAVSDLLNLASVGVTLKQAQYDAAKKSRPAIPASVREV